MSTKELGTDGPKWRAIHDPGLGWIVVDPEGRRRAKCYDEEAAELIIKSLDSGEPATAYGTDGPDGPAAGAVELLPCPGCHHHGVATVGSATVDLWALCLHPTCRVYGYHPFDVTEAPVAQRAAREAGVAPEEA